MSRYIIPLDRSGVALKDFLNKIFFYKGGTLPSAIYRIADIVGSIYTETFQEILLLVTDDLHRDLANILYKPDLTRVSQYEEFKTPGVAEEYSELFKNIALYLIKYVHLNIQSKHIDNIDITYILDAAATDYIVVSRQTNH